MCTNINKDCNNKLHNIYYCKHVSSVLSKQFNINEIIIFYNMMRSKAMGSLMFVSINLLEDT